MTDPNKMKPGPELDGLVAEEVMEWILTRGVWDFELHGYPNEWRSRDGNLMAMETDGLGHGPPAFHPSTDIAAAWEVMKKLKEERIYLGVWPTPGGWDVERWDRRVRWTGNAPTAPLAICLAALAAVRAERESHG